MIQRKKDIEEQIEAQISILKTNSVTMQTPLVDEEGFPRADIDIYAVRGARVRIIELRNDLRDVTEAIGKALETIYDPALATPDENADQDSRPFARVESVAPGSPAAAAVRSFFYSLRVFYTESGIMKRVFNATI